MSENASADRALIDFVRRADHDRFLCALFAPADRHAALFAILAFNQEIARVRETVSEPMLGQIRLQWWREAIEGVYSGTPRRHEVIEPLAQAVRRHRLSRAYFDALIDARERDLDDAPPADMAALEAYAVATAAPLGSLMAETLGAGGSAQALDAAQRAAVAFALVGLMRAVPFHAARSRLYLPAERLAAHGLKPADVFAGRFSPALGTVIGEVLERAAVRWPPGHRPPHAARAALLPATLAALYAKRLRRLGNDPYDSRLSIGPLRRQMTLMAASLRGRF